MAGMAGAGIVAFLLAIAPISALAADSPQPACGHANLDNPGNHYGLIKNGCLLRSPTPAPAPTPISTPIQTPASPRVINPSPNVPATVVPSETPAATGGSLDLRGVGEKSALPQGTAATVPPSRDTNLWLVEALLPTLVIVWLILLGGARSFELRPATPN